MTLFDIHQVEFPGLGWEFSISRGFEVFGFPIYWYGVLIAIGVLLAISYGLKRAEDFSINPDHMIDVALLTIPVAFLGARMYYVFFKDWASYAAEPASILDIRDGGLAIFGGIIVAFVFGPLMCKLKKVKIWAMFDATALGFLIGQGIGRWGNFFNQEAYGGNTQLPWGMTGDIVRSGAHANAELIEQGLLNLQEPVHPTFFYESMWCLLGFVLLHILSKKAYKFHGMIFCGYMVWYGIGRFFIEGLRTDSLAAGTMRISQLVSILAVILGVVLFFVLRRYDISLPKTLVAEGEEEGDTDETDNEEDESEESEESEETNESDESDDVEEDTDGTAD